jgi:hypothetical protein
MVYGVLEELPTGIWILSPTGATVSLNRYAHRICRLLLKSEAKLAEKTQSDRLSADSTSIATSAATPINEQAASSDHQFSDLELAPPLLMPSAVERLYQAVIESRDLFPDQAMIIEDLVQIGSLTVHLRARWLELELDSYILVMLESPQIHPLARLSKLIQRGSVGRIKPRVERFEQRAKPELFLEQLGY